MITLITVPNVPLTEFSEAFAQGMYDRMALSFFKYGFVADGFPNRVNAIETLKRVLEKYEESGNTEYLMDVANYAMIEFMHPRREGAFFRSTDSNESAGRVREDARGPHDRNIVKHEYQHEGD